MRMTSSHSSCQLLQNQQALWHILTGKRFAGIVGILGSTYTGESDLVLCTINVHMLAI